MTRSLKFSDLKECDGL